MSDCYMESFSCVLVVSSLSLVYRCSVRTRRRRRVVRASGYVYERSSRVCCSHCAASASYLESICAKAGLGRACDASAAYYPLISGHQLGIKES